MEHTIKVGKAELTISDARLVRHEHRMEHWSPERRAHAHAKAGSRLKGKYPRKGDAAIYSATFVGNG